MSFPPELTAFPSGPARSPSSEARPARPARRRRVNAEIGAAKAEHVGPGGTHPNHPDPKGPPVNFDRHPIQGLYDAVASRGEPTRAELDTLAGDLTRDTPDTTTAVRRRIQETVDQIVAARDDGAAGLARSIARDEGRALADQLGPYQPPRPARPIGDVVDDIRARRSSPADPDVEKIVAEIPRGI